MVLQAQPVPQMGTRVHHGPGPMASTAAHGDGVWSCSDPAASLTHPRVPVYPGLLLQQPLGGKSKVRANTHTISFTLGAGAFAEQLIVIAPQLSAWAASRKADPRIFSEEQDTTPNRSAGVPGRGGGGERGCFLSLFSLAVFLLLLFVLLVLSSLVISDFLAESVCLFIPLCLLNSVPFCFPCLGLSTLSLLPRPSLFLLPLLSGSSCLLLDLPLPFLSVPRLPLLPSSSSPLLSHCLSPRDASGFPVDSSH